MKKLRGIFIIIMLTSIFLSSVCWAEILKRDDFQDQKYWWDWGASCTSFPWVSNGLAHLILEHAYSYRDCGTYLWDGENIYGYYTAIIRCDPAVRAGGSGTTIHRSRQPATMKQTFAGL